MSKSAIVVIYSCNTSRLLHVAYLVLYVFPCKGGNKILSTPKIPLLPFQEVTTKIKKILLKNSQSVLQQTLYHCERCIVSPYNRHSYTIFIRIEEYRRNERRTFFNSVWLCICSMFNRSIKLIESNILLPFY